MTYIGLSQLFAWIKQNQGNLLSGVIISFLQLAVAYMLVERFVSRYRMQRWGRARLELSASMVVHAQTLCRPLVYYLVVEDGRTFPRRDLHRALSHIKDKSVSFDAMLAMAGRSFATDWFTELALIADRLRSIAVQADIAARAWQQMESGLPRHEPLESTGTYASEFIMTGLHIDWHEDVMLLPSDRTQELFFIFSQSTLNCCVEVPTISERILVLTLKRLSHQELEDTAVIDGNLMRYQASITESVASLRDRAKNLEKNGFYLYVV